jgi:hypothetical protein
MTTLCVAGDVNAHLLLSARRKHGFAWRPKTKDPPGLRDGNAGIHWAERSTSFQGFIRGITNVAEDAINATQSFACGETRNLCR